jgi:tellurite resistance protein
MTATIAAPRKRAAKRVPLNVIGIAFGTAGLAGAWTTATVALNAPAAVGQVLWAVAAAAWLIIGVRYLVAAGSIAAVMSDLRSPVLGPFGALYPVVGSLLAAHLAPLLPELAAVGVWLMALVSVAFGGWFVSSLMTQPRDPAALHGGYLLPTVAATLLTAQSFALIGQRQWAMGFFAVGILFWALIGSALMLRFATGPQIPEPLMPTLAIFSAPPAVAGNAWWAIADGEASTVHTILGATMVALLLPHLFLVRRYLIATFAVGFWALTFTAAASAGYAVRLLTASDGGTAAVVGAWVALVLATTLIAAVAIGSLHLALASRRLAAR